MHARIADFLDLFSRRTFLLRSLIGLILFGLLIAHYMGAYAGSSDTSGYMNDARLLASGELHPEQRSIEQLPPSKLPFMGYIPLGFLPLDNGRMYPTYAMGLPILILVASKVFGWALGPGVVMWLHAIACVITMYFLAREVNLGREISLLGSVILATSAVFLFMSLQAMSDMPATLWATVAVLASLKAGKNAGWAILAGFSFMYGYMVRPTSLLMMLPIIFIFPWNLKKIILFLAGSLPGMIWVVMMNPILYGKVATTGYGNLAEFFGARYFLPSIHNYAAWLPIELTPLVILALCFPFISYDIQLRVRLGLIIWIISLFAFYSVYYCTHEAWWYMRFVLPCYPAIIVAMLVVADRITKQWRLVRYVGGLLLVCGILMWNRHWAIKLNALDIGDGERVYLETCQYIKTRIPGNAVILCMQESGAITYYTKNPIVRWDCIQPDNFPEIVNSCEHNGRDIYMVLFPYEQKDALNKFAGAKWVKVVAIRDIGVWRLLARN